MSLERLAIALSVAAVPGSAAADAFKAKLSVQRSPEAHGCEDASFLATRINRIAGRDAIANGETTVDLALTVERREGTYHAHLVAYGASRGERDFEDTGTTCRALDEAVAVSIALLLDEAPEKTREVPPRPPESAPPEPPPSPPPAAPTPFPQTTFHVLALGSAGVVGTATFGAEAGFEMRLRPLLTVGAGVFGLIQDEERFGRGGISLNLVGVRVPACLSIRAKDQSTGGGFCGFPALGVLHASGHGFAENANASEPWFAMGASAIVFGPLSGPIGLMGRLELVVPVVRPDFVVQDLGNASAGESGVVYRAPPVGFTAAVGVRALIR